MNLHHVSLTTSAPRDSSFDGGVFGDPQGEKGSLLRICDFFELLRTCSSLGPHIAAKFSLNRITIDLRWSALSLSRGSRLIAFFGYFLDVGNTAAAIILKYTQFASLGKQSEAVSDYSSIASMDVLQHALSPRLSVVCLLFLAESTSGLDLQATCPACLGQTKSRASNLPSFDSWLFIIFGSIVLSIIWSLPKLGIVSSHMAWGGPMILFSFIWWNIRLDAETSQIVLWT